MRAGEHQVVVDVRAGVPRVVVVLPVHAAGDGHGFGGVLVIKNRLVFVLRAGRVCDIQARDLVAHQIAIARGLLRIRRVTVARKLHDLVLVGCAAWRIGVKVLELERGNRAEPGSVVGCGDGLRGHLGPQGAVIRVFAVQHKREIGIGLAVGLVPEEVGDLDPAGLVGRGARGAGICAQGRDGAQGHLQGKYRRHQAAKDTVPHSRNVARSALARPRVLHGIPLCLGFRQGQTTWIRP